MKFFKIYILLLSFFAFTACSFRVDKTGYMFESVDFNSVQKGVTSKNTILKSFGSPTIISPIDNDEVWIYYSEEIKHILFFMPKVITREIVVLKFNDEDRINYIKKLSLENEDKKFFINFNKTFVKSHKTNFLKELYDSLATVKP